MGHYTSIIGGITVSLAACDDNYCFTALNNGALGNKSDD